MNTNPSPQAPSAPGAPNPSAPTEIDLEVQEKYGNRLRARLARPKIAIEDARDGMLDCFVSTYFAGVKQGLSKVLGVDASPDQVARVAARMFRDRLGAHGVSFDEPTAEALNAVKEEVDVEFHFRELPAELSAMHDQVCSLLLAKADGLLDHDGDRSVVKPKASAGRSNGSAPVVRPPSFGQPRGAKGGDTPRGHRSAAATTPPGQQPGDGQLAPSPGKLPRRDPVQHRHGGAARAACVSRSGAWPRPSDRRLLALSPRAQSSSSRSRDAKRRGRPETNIVAATGNTTRSCARDLRQRSAGRSLPG